jgi:hypothetical protein
LCLALLGLSGCGNGGRPRPGDTVSPKLDRPIQWTAGKPGQIDVRLQAQGKDEATPRALNFINGVADNPVADVTFFAGSHELTTAKLTLSHRC